MITLHIGGLGLSLPGVTVTGVARATTAPALPPALRRRASPLTLLACDAAGQAAADAGADLSTVPLLLGSAYGEIATAVEMMRSFGEPPGLPSPTRFHNSVHNTPVAYASIAFGNRGFSTALAAGPETVAMTLVEAAALVADGGGGEALVVFADEPVPAPFTPAPWPAAAVAFHVTARPTPATRGRIVRLRRDAPPAPAASAWEAHPCAGAFALAAAIAGAAWGPVALGAAELEWWVDLEAGCR